MDSQKGSGAMVVTLDGNRIREVIARISDCDAAVGQKLTYLTDRFEYTAILEVADGAEELP
jgi:hypothetical protein